MKENILYFKDFKKQKTRITAGIVFIYKNRILLVHPPNHKWSKTFSYPKGRIEKNESIIDCAIRETREEIGVNINKNLLKNNKPYRIVNIDEEFNGLIKIDYFYVLYLNDIMFNKIFKNDYIIKKYKLQKKEIDWAGFLTKDQSLKKIKPRLKKVLDYI